MRVIELKRLPQYLEALRGRLLRAARQGQMDGARASVKILRRSTREVGAVDTGATERGWTAAPGTSGTVLVGNRARHAQFAVGGRRPGRRPPADKIAAWARRRLGLSRAEAKSAGFAIAREIGRRGVRGRRVVERVAAEVRRTVWTHVRRAVAREVRR